MMQLITFLLLFSLFLPHDPLPVAKQVWEKRHALNIAEGPVDEIEEMQQEIRKLANLKEEPSENYLFSHQFLDMVRYSFIYFPSRVSHGGNKWQANILSSKEKGQLIALSQKMASLSKETDITFLKPKPNGEDLFLENGHWVIKKGLCSAASLTWAKSFLQKIDTLKDRSPEEILVAAAFATTPVKDGENQELAILQGAMNTISRKNSTIDPLSWHFKHSKVEALASFLRLKASPYGIPFYRSIPTEEQLENTLQTLENGVYFFRMIQEKPNHKGESFGHSEVIVKGDNILLFYDPNLGVIAFQPEDKVASFLRYFWSNYYISFFSAHRTTSSHLYQLHL